MINFTRRWPQSGYFFSKLGHFFPIFVKVQERSPPPPVVTRLRFCVMGNIGQYWENQRFDFFQKYTKRSYADVTWNSIPNKFQFLLQLWEEDFANWKPKAIK